MNKILLFALILCVALVSGCASVSVPKEYKDNPCSSWCYVQINDGIDPKAVDFYKENKELFKEIEKPVCRNLKELGVTQEFIDAYSCNESQEVLSATFPSCDGCDTFCDCQLKNGSFLNQIVWDMQPK